MESSELCNIEFIDLNGVEENEQLRIKNSLQQYDPSVQLPWIKNQKKFIGKQVQKRKEKVQCSVSTHHNTYIQHPMITQPIFYNHQQPPVVVQPILPYAPNIVYYTTNAMSPVSASYPQQVFIPQSTYSPQAATYTYPIAISQKHNAEDQQKENNITEEEEQEPPKEEVKENGIPENVPEELPKVVNGNENVVKTASPGSGNKSWASLFSTNKPNAVTTTTSENTTKNNDDKSGNKDLNNSMLCPIKYPRKAQPFVDPESFRLGEFLSSYTLDGRTISLEPRGLLNQSNYCYINSILQALAACPPLYNLLTDLSGNISPNENRKKTPVIDAMCCFMKEFKHLPPNMRKNSKKDTNIIIKTDTPFVPTWIFKLLNGNNSELIEGRQEDAEEFLGFLLNGLNDEMLELIKLVRNDQDKTETRISYEEDVEKEWKVMGPKNKGSITRRTEFGKTPISDIFGGLLKSKIHRAGELTTENVQPFFTLQLNIKKVKTVQEALEGLLNTHKLEGLTSSKTKEEIEAWQQVLLDELPAILVLHLKCFDYKANGCTKIIKSVEFPIDMKIDQKLLASKQQNQKERQYKLFAVVYHDGKEATKGHYVTDAFHVGYNCWLRYDDASVKTVQEEHVLKPQGSRVPYLLFYRRCDTIKGK
ncbi:ubiquitin carboxyl-terminal hydrolase 10 [Diorhabda sublineata]|uniref:ubiquitin carboxyl-terminal hydrolase 10 n=1 Tax=Diorhabda sublineata TaxID=1163346 RepID=UPI0024E0F791|nr:ubiquitin carboxyl-terminal hydrolase 10 [Diorhabda sublineata]